MFCKKCGKEIASDMRFCPYCGTKVEEENAYFERKEEKVGYGFNWDDNDFSQKKTAKSDFSFDWESVIDKRTSAGKTFGLEEPKKNTMFKDVEDVRRRTAELNLNKFEEATIEEPKEELKEETAYEFQPSVSITELEKEIFGTYLTNFGKPEEEEKEEPVVEIKEEPIIEAKEEPIVEKKEEPVVLEEKSEKVILEELAEDLLKEQEDLEIEKTLIYTRTSLINQMNEKVEEKEEPIIETKEEPVVEIKEEPISEINVTKEEVKETEFAPKDTLVEKQEMFQDLLDKERERLNDLYGKTSVDIALEESKLSAEKKEEEIKEISNLANNVFGFGEDVFSEFEELEKIEDPKKEISVVIPLEEDPSFTLEDLANEPVKEKEDVKVDLREVTPLENEEVNKVSNIDKDQTIIEDSKGMSLDDIYAYEEDKPKKKHIFLKVLVAILILAVCFEAVVVITNYFFPENDFTISVNGIMDKIMNLVKSVF